MTMAGWVPWLTDTLSLDGGQAVFDTYVRQYSVLLRPGEARQNQVKRWRPWLPARAERRTCPACVADPGRGLVLMWRIPLMSSCAEHGCQLEPESDVRLAALAGNPMEPEPVAPGTIALDRLTFQALTAGRVSLPGGSAHAGVWFRLLRTMLDELSIAPSALTATSAAIVRSVWAAASAPPRAGLTVWRPYEMLRQTARQAMMHAAGFAMQLAAAGEIRPQGALGHYLGHEPHREVYEGDRRAWEWKQDVAEFSAEFGTAVGLARSGDADAARKLLTWYTLGCRTSASFLGARRFLAGLGIPEHLLPALEDRASRPLRAYPAEISRYRRAWARSGEVLESSVHPAACLRLACFLAVDVRCGLAGLAAGAGDRGGVAGDVPCVAAQEGPAAAGEDVVGELLADFKRALTPAGWAGPLGRGDGVLGQPARAPGGRGQGPHRHVADAAAAGAADVRGVALDVAVDGDGDQRPDHRASRLIRRPLPRQPSRRGRGACASRWPAMGAGPSSSRWQ
jgi:hypothetical protein